MANYLKGIGDSVARVNEILPSMDARIYNFLGGHASGIIRGEFNDFNASAIDRGVRIRSGMMQAHGYYGLCDTDTQINFVMPASGTRFSHIFAEVNLMVVPNRFSITSTPLSNTNAWTPVQNNLRINTSGRFQLPLFLATITATNITLTDRRTFIDRPNRANEALNFTAGGTIAAELAAVRAEMIAVTNRMTALESGTERLVRILNAPTEWARFGANITVNTTVNITRGQELFAVAEVRTFNETTVSSFIGRVRPGSSSLASAELTHPFFATFISSRPIGIIQVGFTMPSSPSNRITTYAGLQGGLAGLATNADFANSTTGGRYRIAELYRVDRG